MVAARPGVVRAVGAMRAVGPVLGERHLARYAVQLQQQLGTQVCTRRPVSLSGQPARAVPAARAPVWRRLGHRLRGQRGSRPVQRCVRSRSRLIAGRACRLWSGQLGRIYSRYGTCSRKTRLGDVCDRQCVRRLTVRLDSSRSPPHLHRAGNAAVIHFGTRSAMEL